MVKITINGERVSVLGKSLAYDELIRLVWPKVKSSTPRIVFTVYETNSEGMRTGKILQSGSLLSGDRIVVAPGLVLIIND